MMGLIGSLWGLAGVSLLIGSAIYRLTTVAVQAFSHKFLWYHWLSLGGISIFMAYAEGYHGFQQRFSPRVAARARYLKDHPNTRNAILGPLFCMGYFHATKRRKITSISLTVGIVVLILLVRLVPQPWRGLVDVGVVIGLAWGLVSVLLFGLQAFGSGEFKYSPEVPDADRRRARMSS
jgi:hypothetical protein